MTYNTNPLHEAADKVAELTGVPKLMRKAEAKHPARRQIMLPAVAIAGSVIAFIATLYGVHAIGALSGLFFVLTIVAQQFGPVRPRNAAMPYDECEQLLIWRSRSVGMGAALGLAIIGCSTISLYDAFQDVPWQLPANSALAAMWLLVTTATGLTTISASLLLPKEIAEEEI